MAFNIADYIAKLKKASVTLYNKIKEDISHNNHFNVILNKYLSLKPKNRIIVCAVLTLALTSGLALTVQAFSGAGEEAGHKISASPHDTGPAGGPPARGRVDRSNLYLMARVIEGEAADEPMEGKVAVGAVIVNRIESKEFPNNLRQVVYQPLAFEAVANGQYTRPVTKESLRAAELALRGSDPTGGALYYWNPAKAQSQWVWQRPITKKIGRHVFAM
ncbi:MAG: cell wall hydrolase [Peptococcaceae bacterium]|nr:cell wall hydrolase [Peptococcaceae bacterium]